MAGGRTRPAAGQEYGATGLPADEPLICPITGFTEGGRAGA
jgi:hypothetical protein